MFSPFMNSVDLNFDFNSYFRLPRLSLPMKIGSDSIHEVFFHWADWNETCHVQYQLLFNSQHGGLKIDHIKENIQNLKKTQIWIDRQGRRIQSNLKELYCAYTDPILRYILFDHSKDGFEISFNGPQGPFVDALSLRWLRQDIFLNFIYMGLFERKIPYREFRLRYDKEVPSFINDPHLKINFGKIYITQLSPEGILFRVPRDVLLQWKEVNRFQNISPSVDFSLLKQDFLLFSKTNFKINVKEFLDNFNQNDALKMTVRADFPLFLAWDKFIPEEVDENFLESMLRPFLKMVKKEMEQSLNSYMRKHPLPK